MIKDQASCLFIGAFPSSLVSFRGSLIKAMLAKGIKVYTAANGRNPDTEAKLHAIGVEYFPIRIARAGMNPLDDITTIFDLIRLMRRVKPGMVLSYTIKPVIYGGLVARLSGVQNVFSMIEGLGSVFMPWESLSQIFSSIAAKWLYRIGLLASKRVFFLNPDDFNQFIRERYVSKRKAVLLNGIGIDLAYYTKEELAKSSPLRFLMITRLLKSKGVREYVAAAKLVKASYRNIEFILAGCLDDNPSSIKQEELDLWQREGIVNHVGLIDDVRPLLKGCHVYVLPSFYREGTPRTLLEAMAAGRAIITTDNPGCRETVDRSVNEPVWKTEENTDKLKRGRNGIIVPIKDVESLAAAMKFFSKHPEQIAIMGKESRSYAEERYDVHKVNAVILREMGLSSDIILNSENKKQKQHSNLYILSKAKLNADPASVDIGDPLYQQIQFSILKYNLGSIFLKPFHPMYFYWWLVYLPRMICGKSGFDVYSVYADGRLVHRTFLLPKCFKFPFMAENDLFVGLVWTHPSYRRKGLSQFAFRQIQNECKKNMNDSNIRFWWLVLETNTASIELAKRLGFSDFGLRARRRWGIYKTI
jgi:glycosyltransferase involved in cell wall biosynthesis/GNAT superfamily N-acetyltransferase